MFDPSLLHYWTDVRPRGEWPTAVIEPACAPRERRTVSTRDIDPGVDTPTGERCPVCAEVVAALAERAS